MRSEPELSAAYVTRASMALRDEDSALADRQLDAALAINQRDRPVADGFRKALKARLDARYPRIEAPRAKSR